jgi:hypothetical protein
MNDDRNAAQQDVRTITETPAFKTWFLDSKVTDHLGRPMRLYHGTARDFDAFNPDNKAHFFTPDPSFADGFAFNACIHETDEARDGREVVMPVFLKARKPFDPRTPECAALMKKWDLGKPSDYNYAEWDLLQDLEIITRIRALGYDGIWMREEARYDTIAVFEPNQIKSAIGNNGEFDPVSPSITGH